MKTEVQNFIDNNYLSVQESGNSAALFLTPDPRVRNDKFLQLTPFLPKDHLESWIEKNTSRIINILQSKDAKEMEKQFEALFPMGFRTSELYAPVSYYKFTTSDLSKFYDTNFGDGAFSKLGSVEKQALVSSVQKEISSIDLGNNIKEAIRVFKGTKLASAEEPDLIKVDTYDLFKHLGFKEWLDLSQDEQKILARVISNHLSAVVPIHRSMLAAFNNFRKEIK